VNDELVGDVERDGDEEITFLSAVPEDWVRRLGANGVDVVWRMFGGEAEDAPRDRAAYEGWFLQERARVGTSRGGILFLTCRHRDGKLVVQLQRWDGKDVSDDLWTAAKRAVAEFDPSELSCGNCAFSTPEWRTFVRTGVLPARLLVAG
jgi:hypothetical protein